jgi:hypothetical protein
MKTSDLFTKLGLEKLSDQEKLNLSEDLGGVALDRIAARFEEILTPEQALEFERLLKTDESKAFALLETFIPDYASIARDEIETLQAEIVDTHTAVMKKLKS